MWAARGLAAPARGPAAALLGKCLSVMKADTLRPEGPALAGGGAWSTPDRIPHRFMWLWDSVFHALAMAKVRHIGLVER